MSRPIYYVKSLEEDFASKTLKNKQKVTYQTVQNMVKTKKIKLNTLSFGRKRRLCCTILHKNYAKTYRPHGIIFQTKQKPDYILPFDLVLLSATNNILVHYYRIKKNLHMYYNHPLIEGFEQFIFNDFNKLIHAIRSPEVAWKKVNAFREANGYDPLPQSKYRLFEYNEAVFEKEVTITPIALFGYRKETKIIAQVVGLPHFRSAKAFFNKINLIDSRSDN